MTSHYPDTAPLLAPGEAVALFDGTCKLCNGWAKFVISHDKAIRIKLATVQSPVGQELLGWAGLPQHEFNTIVFITGDRIYVRSDAMLRIFARLPAPWRWLTIARFVPRPWRDWLYDKIALNRYRMFGRYDAAQRPIADRSERFLTRSSR